MKPYITVQEVLAAVSDPVDALEKVAGLPPEVLDGRHHPCPKCGGSDRFRLIDAKIGTCYCNQCFNTKCGNFLSAVIHFREIPFRQALEECARYAGILKSEEERRFTPKTVPKEAEKQTEVKNKYQFTKSFTPLFNADGTTKGMRLSCFAEGRKPFGFDFRWNGYTYQPSTPPKANSKVKKHTLYEYVSGDGSPHHLVYRMDFENGRKIPALYHWNGQNYESGKGDLTAVPFNAPEVKEASKVFIVEGEKCAAALQWDIDRSSPEGEEKPAVTCFLDGAAAFQEHYISWFRDKEIMIFPDNDKPGYQFARELVSNLYDTAKSVKVFKWPEGTPEKWDIADEILKKHKSGKGFETPSK